MAARINVGDHVTIRATVVAVGADGFIQTNLGNKWVMIEDIVTAPAKIDELVVKLSLDASQFKAELAALQKQMGKIKGARNVSCSS